MNDKKIKFGLDVAQKVITIACGVFAGKQLVCMVNDAYKEKKKEASETEK